MCISSIYNNAYIHIYIDVYINMCMYISYLYIYLLKGIHTGKPSLIFPFHEITFRVFFPVVCAEELDHNMSLMSAKGHDTTMGSTLAGDITIEKGRAADESKVCRNVEHDLFAGWFYHVSDAFVKVPVGFWFGFQHARVNALDVVTCFHSCCARIAVHCVGRGR